MYILIQIDGSYNEKHYFFKKRIMFLDDTKLVNN